MQKQEYLSISIIIFLTIKCGSVGGNCYSFTSIYKKNIHGKKKIVKFKNET